MHKILKRTFILTIPLFLCGINKVFFNKKLKIVQAILCPSFVLLSITLYIVALLNSHKVESILWMFFRNLEYLQLLVTTTMIAEEFIKKFESKMQIIESNIKAKSIFNVAITNVLIVVMFLYRLWHIFIVIKLSQLSGSEKFTFAMSQVMGVCAELDGIWRMFLMLTVKSKIDELYETLKELYPREWFETDEVESEVQKEVTNLMEAYTTLAELTDDIAKAIQISFVFRLAFDMAVIFLVVFYFTKHGGSLMFSSFTIFIVFLTVLTLSPCVILENIKSKSFHIKILLIQQGLRANIKSKEKRALQLFNSVITSQPIRLRVFGSYDMDFIFIVHYLQFLATYSIFILQSAKYKFF